MHLEVGSLEAKPATTTIANIMHTNTQQHFHKLSNNKSAISLTNDKETLFMQSNTSNA